VLQTFFACAYIGAACVTLNYAFAEHEFVELLKIIGEKYSSSLNVRAPY
jgi:acyl-CoA synthetase (AMP-forming)/AMP-acid ligase II